MEYLKDKPLNEKQLVSVKKHKYRAEGITYLEEYLQPFWNAIVPHVPRWIAPNLITLVGLLLNALSLSWLLFERLYYGRGSFSTYIYCGVSLFIYQTLDSIDGKHARNIGVANPLGELLTTAVTPSPPFSFLFPSPFYFCAGVILASHFFYCSHWVAYVTGALHFGRIDVIEAHYACIFSYFFTAFVGEEFWDNVYVLDYPVRWAYYAVLIGGLAGVTPRYCDLCTTAGSGMNGSTCANTSILSPSGPVFCVLTLGVQVIYRSGLYKREPILSALIVALAIAKITNKLIVATITKKDLCLWDPILVALIVLFMNQYWYAIIPEVPLLYLGVAYSIFNLATYLNSTYHQIADCLDVNILTVKEKSKKQ
ncbi:Oidioi.mRNA.OKI2018_I69.XSR.g13850.t1.cds [Oikopleura dioica]|uniref:Oidioi.mRNA.OKI2018_I69.XSR.g13850.t1.cds n=1 Tax=Oikopleura dioica TaxID=34765 RepID=A0ABN7S8J1_OIKDI|nr:Oidioi.mRNA.OKI2018_I69.XSR.g13850.t1.cds [Oikopleura dioica]